MAYLFADGLINDLGFAGAKYHTADKPKNVSELAAVLPL